MRGLGTALLAADSSCWNAICGLNKTAAKLSGGPPALMKPAGKVSGVW